MANTKNFSVPTTIVTVDINGQTDFTIPFEFLARRFVVVTLIGVDRKTLSLNVDYRFVGTNKIALKEVPSGDYTKIELRRVTSATDRLVTFTDGSILRANDMNLAQVQTMHVAEEARDLTSMSIGVNIDGDLDARGRRIVNLGNGVNDFDAVNLGQLRQFDTSTANNADKAKAAADSASASEDRCTIAEAKSVSSAGTAMTAAADANRSKTAAVDSANKAEAAKDIAVDAANRAWQAPALDAERLREDLLAAAMERRNNKMELKDFVSIREFGVVFDNVTDNTAALTAAFTSGKTVYIPRPPAGMQALIKDTVRVGNGTTIFGPGRWEFIIKCDASMGGEKDAISNLHYKGPTLVYDDGIYIEGLGIDCNGLNRSKSVVGEWGRGFRMSAVRHGAIINCGVRQALQHGIDITNYNDEYNGMGHNGNPVGQSHDFLVDGFLTVDTLYDDGITTHASYNLVIINCLHVITDEVKAVHQFQDNSKAIEVDDCSHDVYVSNCHAYCNNTKFTAFSISCHANNPATYNITFENCYAYGARILINAWTDTNSDVQFGTPAWKARNIIFRNITMLGGYFEQGNPIFPNRIVSFSGYMDVLAEDIFFRVADRDGSYTTPVSVAIAVDNTHNAVFKNFNVRGVPQVPVVAPAAARSVGWVRIAQNCKNISIDGFRINTLGYWNRLISDSTSAALVKAHNIIIEESPTDGDTKTAIVSNSQTVSYKNISVPAGVAPYSVGRTFTRYPAGNYLFNQLTRDTIIGGVRIQSETLADNTQAKAGIYFDNQFYSASTTKVGKGSIAYRTSDAREASFSVMAHHEDTDDYIPIIAVRSHKPSGVRSFEAGVDNTTTCGRNTSRWSQVYAVTGTINTSDIREKTGVKAIDDQILDVWGKINHVVFQWLTAQQAKGKDAARWHFGLIAQQVRDAFLEAGLDGTKYGLLCYDEWVDEETGEKKDRWGLRHDQCAFLEAAYMRREVSRLSERLAAIEKNIK